MFRLCIRSETPSIFSQFSEQVHSDVFQVWKSIFSSEACVILPCTDLRGTCLQISGLLGAACFGARTVRQYILLGMCICQQPALRGRGYQEQPPQHLILQSHADVSRSSLGARCGWNPFWANLVLLRRVHCCSLSKSIKILRVHIFASWRCFRILSYSEDGFHLVRVLQTSTLKGPTHQTCNDSFDGLSKGSHLKGVEILPYTSKIFRVSRLVANTKRDKNPWAYYLINEGNKQQ